MPLPLLCGRHLQAFLLTWPGIRRYQHCSRCSRPLTHPCLRRWCAFGPTRRSSLRCWRYTGSSTAWRRQLRPRSVQLRLNTCTTRPAVLCTFCRRARWSCPPAPSCWGRKALQCCARLPPRWQCCHAVHQRARHLPTTSPHSAQRQWPPCSSGRWPGVRRTLQAACRLPRACCCGASSLRPPPPRCRQPLSTAARCFSPAPAMASSWTCGNER